MAIQYTMRAFNIVLNEHVYWFAIGAPDFSGSLSGYAPANLTGIVVDYSTTVPNTIGSGNFSILTLSGDVSGPNSSNIVTGLQTHPVKSQSLTGLQDGYVLTWVNSDGYWEAKHITSGSVTLMGDVTGPANSNIVTEAQNGLVTFDGTHGRGTFGGAGSDFKTIVGPLPSLETSGASLHLLSNAGSATSSNYTIYGDGSNTILGTQGAGSAIYFSNANNGLYAHINQNLFSLDVTPTINWARGVISPLIQQDGATGTTAGQNLTIAPQAGGGTSGVPGALVINIAVPSGGSAENFVKIERGGTTHWQIGPLTSVPTTFGAFYPGGVTPSGSNYAFYIADDGSNMGFNSSSLVGFNIGGANQLSLTTGIMYWAAGIVSPTFGQGQPASDVATTNILLQAQAPFPSATVNRHPGQIVVEVPTPLGANDFFGGLTVQATSGNTPLVRIGHYGGPDLTYAAIYFMDAGSANQTNFGFLGNQNITYLNAPANGTLVLSINGNSASGINSTYNGSGSGTWTMVSGSGIGNLNFGTNVSGGVLNLRGGVSSTQIAISGSTVTLASLAGSGSGYVAVSNTGVLSFTSSISPGGAAGGDLGGTYPNPTVAKLRGNLIQPATYGSAQDGYVLTWVNADGYIEAKPASGGTTPDLGDLFGTTRVQYWSGGFNGFGLVQPAVNCILNSTGGSGANVNGASGSLLLSTARELRQFGGGTGWIGQYEGSFTNWAWRGSTAGLGGFTLYTSASLEETQTVATIHAFVGLTNTAGASRPLTTDLATQTAKDAIGFGTSQTTSGAGALTGNWQVISCDGTTTNLVDSGMPITKAHLYLFKLSCIANDSLITWKITDLTAATTATGTVNTNLPRNSQFMGWQAGMNVTVAGSGGDGSNSWSTARYMLKTNQ